MAEGKKIENKAKAGSFFGIVKTRFMTLRLEEIASISRDEPPKGSGGGSLILVFKSGAQQNLKYNNLKERNKDYDKIDDAMSQSSQQPTKNLD